MKLLAIETATEACSVALSVDGDLLGRSELSPRGHAELVLPWVSELLAESELSLQQLDAIAFSRGPGSFTSLRIGIGVTQGLAWGAGLPVVPVSSLQNTAQVAVGKGVKSAIVALDARMNEVYCGTFTLTDNGLMSPLGEETVCSPAKVCELNSVGFSGVGIGFERYPELAGFAESLESVHPQAWPDARAMIPLAIQWLESNSPLAPEQAQAVYIRDKVAEKPSQ